MYQLTEQQLEIEKREAEKLIASLSLYSKSDFQKVLTVNKWLAKNVVYQENIKSWSEYHTAYSAIVNGRAVCTGYAEAMTELLNNSGGECYCVTGWFIGGKEKYKHSWCIVRVDEKYYYIDPTGNNVFNISVCFLQGKLLGNKSYVVDDEYKEIDEKVSKFSYFTNYIFNILRRLFRRKKNEIR